VRIRYKYRALREKTVQNLLKYEFKYTN
jgi:hypothetical protein